MPYLSRALESTALQRTNERNKKQVDTVCRLADSIEIMRYRNYKYIGTAKILIVRGSRPLEYVFTDNLKLDLTFHTDFLNFDINPHFGKTW